MVSRRISTQTATGAVIVAIGVLLLLGTTRTLDVGALWRYVPSLFVLLGLWAIYRSGFRNLTGPIVLIVIAGTVQLLALDVISGDVIAAWWPLLVVLLGLSLLAGHWRGRRRVPSIGADDFDLIGVFGGTERRVTSRAFRGGTATAVFGGVEVDLRDAAVAEPPAVVTATALFGGIDLEVPEDWVVVTDVLPVFGAVEEDRRRPAADAPREGEADLIVTGFVGFGGITIS